MSRAGKLIRMLPLVPAVGILWGCGSGEGLGGPRELPPENTAAFKAAPQPVKKVRVPKNFIPGVSNRNLKGKSAD